MINIIVAFPKEETGQNVKRILLRSGFHVTNVVTNGAQVLSSANELNQGLVISSYRFSDMMFHQIKEYLPAAFQMIVIAKQNQWAEMAIEDVINLSPPIQVQELVHTVEMITLSLERLQRKQKKQKTIRSSADEKIIQQAKNLLMERNHMTEPEAHRYLQKNSMDMSRGVAETAQMILSLND